MDAFNRRIQIINSLMESRKTKIENLANEFSVSDRTIRKDIQELARVYSVITVQGYGGGVCLMPSYRPTQNTMTQRQIEALERCKKNCDEADYEIFVQMIREFGPYHPEK